MNEKNNSIINSLKRLERAGSENSKTNAKLKLACKEVAEKIISMFNEDVKLPHGYEIEKIESNYFLLVNKRNISMNELDMNYPFGLITEDALQFSKDISEGLLDEISDFLEKRTKRSEEAIEVLENAEI